MDALQLVTVRGAINACGENLAKRRFKMTFSNNQEFEFSANKQTVLSSLGFTGNFKTYLDDKKIKTAYDNLSQFKRLRMIETAEAMEDIFSIESWVELSSFSMLTYEDFENKLELVVSPEGCDRYVLFEINPYAKRIDNISAVDDILLNLSGKRFVIPVSMTCTKDNKVIVDERLSKKQTLKAKKAAKSLALSCSATFNDKLIKVRPKPPVYKKKK